MKESVNHNEGNNNTDVINNSNSSMNTNSCRETTLHSDISPLLKHQSLRQELNEPCPKKKFKYQPKSSSSITCNDTFKLVQDYHKSKLKSLKHNSTINRINNKMKCHYIRNDKMNYELDTIHNPYVFCSNLSTNHQKYALWNNHRKRISTLGSSIRSKKKTSQHPLDSCMGKRCISIEIGHQIIQQSPLTTNGLLILKLLS
ncbi:hypothetical protein Smp_145950 [Schistosoma mansoni]|uniref:hypothetical protein n=1 Tax=Schistosoma mansoni TaxID=6183 RepID=UPI0001A62EEB|nr:hypothetical protein Smp_145950 [Schistosoma mansoni]|eukprot:XP_018650962.1 hypothetical protein Smp_145950 [Schistosoma mansoni]